MKSKKKLPIWAVVLSALVVLSSLLTIFTGERVYKKTFKTTPHEIKRRRLHERRLQQLSAYEHQSFLIESSKNKYNIEVMHIQSKLVTNKVIVLVHGIRSNFYDLLPTAFRYLNDGYHIILYNQRQSGLTGGKTSTFGLYERFDLEEVATVARRIYKNAQIGVHGFSMGAATAIMQSELNETSNLIDFYMLDAPFHTMASTIELAARRGAETRIPPWYLKFSGDAVLRLRQRVAYKDIAPLSVIHHTTRPVLLIHGELDDVTSPDGSRQLFGAIHHNQRRLEIFPEQGHCTAHLSVEDEYFERVHRFIADYL
ncbi:MAG: alpha/beta hydrolase [Turicibacter sp.]|nr:alpha/beta hydrolase [Turicibacter sp.]